MTINVRGLKVKLGAFELDIPELDLPARSLTSIIGPNGAGKSTLLRSLASVIDIKSGVITVDGRRLSDLPGRVRAGLIGYVPQELTVQFNYSVLDFVLTGRAAYVQLLKGPSERDTLAAREALAYVGLAGLESTPVLNLSSGVRRLVMIARALAQESETLLLDEPTSFLDPRNEIDAVMLMRRLVDEKGKTVIVALHSLEMAVNNSDHLVLIKGGRIEAFGLPETTVDPELLKRIYQVDFEFVRHNGRLVFINK